MAVLGLCCCMGLSLVTVSGGCSLVAAHGLIVGAPGLRCSAACGIFQDQELNPCLLHWQVDIYP